MRTTFDGERLTLVTGHTATIVMTALLVLAAVAGVYGYVLAVTFSGDPTAGRVTAGVTASVAFCGILVFGVARAVRRYPRPTLQVTSRGVEARAYGERWQVPWADVESIGRWQTPLGDFRFAVDIAAGYWTRVGRRWHEPRKGGVHGDAEDISNLITFPVRGMTVAQALRHAREVAPPDVRVDVP